VTPPARLAAAIALLEAIDADAKRPADAVASGWFRARRFIGAGDRRAVSDLTWRVLRSWRRLNWWLGEAATPRLLVAASSVLDGMPLAGLMRAFSGGRFAPEPLNRGETEALRRLDGHTLDHPAMPEPVRLEVPAWVYPKLQARFGADLAAELAALARPPTLDLRVNILKGTREQAHQALAAEGIEASPTPFSPWGLRIAGRRLITGLPLFRSGLVEIQDEGSQLVAALVDARPGQRVCDYCAGAGGKTLAIAMTMENRGHMVACDVSAVRLEGAVQRLRRAGVHNAERHLLAPGDRWAKRRKDSFDRVLVDAPCTGTGTWRRNPDARRRLKESDLAELLPKQASILDAASGLVRSGGRLVYATCSLLPEENEAQVDAFLARTPAFELIPLDRAWAGGPVAGRFLSLTPARNGTDGFFAAVMERKK
jgi:16S rRNA (cytosine967-C5)-methyltransferase